jgi:hypothetical protein
MSHDETAAPCRSGAIFSLGLTVGIVVGLAVGSVVGLRLGGVTIDAVRGLIDRMSGRGNQVNFELLLQ